jgi:CO/xanthine dehydrogenase Mo-binding subunit
MALDTPAAATARPARYVGQSIKRVEDPRLLAGKARFIDDLSLPGMLHASFVRSPYAHARVTSIDTSRALALDGVVAVFTGADLAEHIGPLVASGPMRDEVLTAMRQPLATEKVRHVGDAVAVVVATTPYIAEDGRDLVDVSWEPLPPVLDPETALEPDAPLLDESLGTNNIAHIENSAGDVERAFAEADHVFSKRFVVGRSTAAPIEGRGIIAEYDERGGGHMTIHVSSQMPHLHRLLIAPVLGMPEGRITVRVPDVGGAFGLKCTVFPEDAVIPAVARRLGRPVKWIEDRWENLAAALHSKGMVCSMDIAVDADGTFQAFRGHFITDSGGYSSVPFTPVVDSQCAGNMLPSCYAIDNVAYAIDNPLTNKCQIGAVRGVGWVPGQLAREVAIDDVARALDLDPVDLRLRNMMGPEPQRNAFGATYDGGSYVASLELARDTLGYEDFRERQRVLREQGRYIGVGFSPFVEPTGWATKSAVAGGLPNGFFDTASVTMEPDGSVTVTTGLHSHGQGYETTLAQVAADELGLPIEMVRIAYGDTDSASYGMGTYASRGAVIGTGTIMEAAGEVRDRLLRLAGTLLEASHQDVELRDGQAAVKGAPNRSVPIGQVAIFGYFGGDARPDEVQRRGLTATAAYDANETYANGCAAAVVEVDVETGLVTLEQMIAVEDCGVVLNPMIVRGQVSGAVAQGIGIALLEDCVYDDEGEFVSGSLLHYLFPTTGEVPMMDLRTIETPSACSAGGVKGVGEAGTIATPAAIVNAVADALSPLGVRIDRTPVTPTYLREVIRAAGGAERQ